MVDPIAIAEKIIDMAVYIHQTIDEIKKFKDLAKELDYQTQLLQPSLQALADMKNQRQQLSAAQERDPEMNLFSQALHDILICVDEIKVFMDHLKHINTLRKFMEKGAIMDKFDSFKRRLDVLEKSIQLGVLVEMKREIDNGKKGWTAQTLVDRVKKSTVAGLSASAMAKDVFRHEWHPVKTFQGTKGMTFKRASAVAPCPNGNLLVVDSSFELHSVYLFNHNGTTMQTLNSSSSSIETELIRPQSIAVTSQGNIVVVDRSKYVKLFNTSGTYRASFCTLTVGDEETDTKVRTESVSVSKNGHICVGDIERGVITVHSEIDGIIDSNNDKINLSIKPEYLTVTSNSSNQAILASDFNSRKVVAVDLFGNTLFSIDSWIVDGKPASPWGLTCDTEDNIYVVVRTMRVNSGHIHVYNDQGVYRGCIAEGLFWPKGITWFNGSLYVANDTSIVIYNPM